MSAPQTRRKNQVSKANDVAAIPPPDGRRGEPGCTTNPEPDRMAAPGNGG